MKNKLVFLLSSSFILIAGVIPYKDEQTQLKYPESWPKPHYNFTSKPLMAEKIELGRILFYDPILSKDSTISCSSCQLSFTAFTHVDHALSHGIDDRIGTRNSPVLINLAWSKHFMWDGAVNHLDVQALAPIDHPDEMGESINGVVDKLNQSEKYKQWFKTAFDEDKITGSSLLTALAQFQLTLISSNSKYDQVKRGEIEFTEQEEKGYQLFLKNCNSCHKEPLFTNHEFKNNGLPLDSTLNDFGRMFISQNSMDSLKFKVPTLRNIEFSYPYMHDGRFKNLTEVMNHYQKEVQDSKTLSKEMKKIQNLSSNDKVDLTAFLLTLSDKEFLFNPKYRYPIHY